jgi:CcmD family protein
MGTFIIAYLVIWLAVSGYVSFLGIQQHRLAKDIAELRAEMTKERTFDGATSEAA